MNNFGVGLWDAGLGLSAYQRVARLHSEQQALLDSEKDCTKICEWLSAMKAVQTPDESSYGLKHVAEEEIGYVTNGVFIAAAVHCGFPYKLANGSENVLFGISKKSIKIKRELYGMN